MINTTSLPTSKALKDAGFSDNTEFYWYEDKLIHKEKDKNYMAHTYAIAAPTTDELLEQLPKKINTKNQNWELHILCNEDSFGVSYKTIISKEYNHFLGGKKFEYCWDYLYATCQHELSESLAQMWLYLKQQNLIK